MQSIHALVAKLKKEYPVLRFVEDTEFRWSQEDATIYFDPNEIDADACLLHELAHYLLGHNSYANDMELLSLERDAWAKAKTQLAPLYNIAVSNKVIDDAMNTYREWLYKRSLCPICQATGMQIQKNTYTCIACLSRWSVNDAKEKQLRRRLIQK